MELKHITFLVLIIATLYSYGQNKETKLFSENNKLGISFAYSTENDFVYFKPIAGGGSTDVDNYFSIGIDYLKAIKGNRYVETGINVAYQQVTVNSAPLGDASFSLPAENFVLINIPLYVRQEFLRFFFINGGVLLDFDANMNGNYDNQTGLGFGAGLGIHHTFNSGFGFYLSPFLKIHSALPMSISGHHQRYFENALKLGINYKF